jgi:hypothetical protein
MGEGAGRHKTFHRLSRSLGEGLMHIPKTVFEAGFNVLTIK